MGKWREGTVTCRCTERRRRRCIWMVPMMMARVATPTAAKTTRTKTMTPTMAMVMAMTMMLCHTHPNLLKPHGEGWPMGAAIRARSREHAGHLPMASGAKAELSEHSTTFTMPQNNTSKHVDDAMLLKKHQLASIHRHALLPNR